MLVDFRAGSDIHIAMIWCFLITVMFLYVYFAIKKKACNTFTYSSKHLLSSVWMTSGYLFKILFIRHIHNYTEYNQQWNVSQVRSMDGAIIWNTNKNINIGMKKNKVRIKNRKEYNIK